MKVVGSCYNDSQLNPIKVNTYESIRKSFANGTEDHTKEIRCR